MKKIHFIDSLKFVRAILVAIACVFAFMIAPAHADIPAGYTQITSSDTTNYPSTLTGYTKYTITGTGNWSKISASGDGDAYFRYRIADTDIVGTGAQISNMFNNVDVSSNNTYVGFRFFYSSTSAKTFVVVRDSSKFTSVETAKSYFNENPLMVLVKTTTDTDDVYRLVKRYSDGVIGYYCTTGANAGDFVPAFGALEDNSIKIATTRYNENQFAPVETRLDAAVAAVDTVVTQTMTQAQQIDDIANNKQTRPNEGCTAKYCLLVEEEDGTPHWYPIVGANGNLGVPDGYVEFDWVETDRNVRVLTDSMFDSTKTVTVTATAQSSVSSASGTRILYGFGSNAGTWTGVTNVWTSGNNAVSDVVATTKVGLKTEWNDGYEYFYVNDNYVGRRSISGDLPANSTLSIFQAGSSNTYFIGKLYGLKLLVDGDVKMQLVPVQRVSDNVVGLYDVVNGAFYTVTGGNVGND